MPMPATASGEQDDDRARDADHRDDDREHAQTGGAEEAAGADYGPPVPRDELRRGAGCRGKAGRNSHEHATRK